MALIETRRIALLSVLGLASTMWFGTSAGAGETTFCVTCAEPAKTYSCTVVTTPDAYPGSRALRLYCIVRTAKDGGHKRCGAKLGAASSCNGEPRTYSYKGPAIPSALRSKAEKVLQGQKPEAEAADEDVKKSDTLVKVTRRAVKSSRKGLSNAGSGVRKATKNTTKRVGGAVKGAGAGVGNAARTTYRCLASFFRDCWWSEDAETEDRSPQTEASTEPQ